MSVISDSNHFLPLSRACFAAFMKDLVIKKEGESEITDITDVIDGTVGRTSQPKARRSQSTQITEGGGSFFEMTLTPQDRPAPYVVLLVVLFES